MSVAVSNLNEKAAGGSVRNSPKSDRYSSPSSSYTKSPPTSAAAIPHTAADHTVDLPPMAAEDDTPHTPLRDYVRECEDLVPAPIIPNPKAALRPNPPTTKQPYVPRSPSRDTNQLRDAEAMETELDRLRTKLRAQSARAVGGNIPLSPEPPRNGHSASYHRGTHSALPHHNQTQEANENAPSSRINGTNFMQNGYATSEDQLPAPPVLCASEIPEKPYESIRSTIRTVEDDKEIEDLMYQLKAREARMLKRKRDLEAAWSYSRRQQSTNSIRAPEPQVMFAPEEEVIERAARIEAKEALFSTVPIDTANVSLGMLPAARESKELMKRSTISPRQSIDGRSITGMNPFRGVGFHMSSLDPSSSTTSYDLSRRRTSAMRVSDASLAILAAFDNELTVDIVMPGPEEVENDRQGDVLNSKSILKRDLYDAAFTRRDQVGVMAGAPYFRMVPKFNVGGVAQAHTSGIRAALNEVRKVYSSGPIVWVTLREEPVLYVNGRSHIIRSVEHPLKPVAIVGISGSRIAHIETKLKAEVLAESQLNGGNICVHRETANGNIDMLWEAVEEESVATLTEVFEEMNERGYGVHYVRHPIAQGVGPQPTDFQRVFDLCMEFPHAPIIYNCQTGKGRSSIMMVISTIVKFYQFCQRDISIDVSLMSGDGAANSYKTILRLISLLPDGALHERRVAVLSELSDKIYSISAHVNALFKSPEVNVNALIRLRQYAYLICFSCFCEARMWSKTFKGTFTEWFEQYPEAKTLLHNVVTQAKHHVAAERIETPAGEDHEVALAVRRRRGNVLSSNMILRSQPKDQSTTQSQVTIPGVLALRQLCPDVPIFTCGRATEQGRNDLLYNIRLAFPNIKGIQWISTRDEPMVFINGTGYSLLDYSVLTDENAAETVMHIGAEKIEELEEKLVKDVLAEAELHKGYIIVHEMENMRETVPKKIKVSTVHTPRMLMKEFSEKNDIKYIRMPMPVDWMATPADFDALLEHVANNVDDDEAVVINDTDGAMRTTLVLNYITIIRAARNGLLRELRTVPVLQDVLMGHPADRNGKNIGCAVNRYHGLDDLDNFTGPLPELQIASQVCQMLAAGSLIYTTSAVLEMGGRGPEWNVLDALEIAKETMQKAIGEQKISATRKALSLARKYLMVLLCALYIDDQQGYNPEKPLSKWCAGLKEINHILERFEERPQLSLKFVVKDNLMAQHSGARAIQRRTSEVLTANFVMKADHFKGCAKPGIGPAIDGAPNFRKVDFVNIYGVAIPTRIGVQNVLSSLGAFDIPYQAYPTSPMQGPSGDINTAYPAPKVFDAKFTGLRYAKPIRSRVIWVNLREEPFLYINDRPCVFRDLAVPFANVELTGIESQKVEHVERKLKMDILKEAQSYEGQFLVHDEGKGVGEIVGMWEQADHKTITTSLELYQGYAEQGARVEFLRLPVTDEQSPELKDFDSLVLALLPRLRDASEPLSFIFNCQMGRGRTTTGMVICCLLIGLVYPEYYEALDRKYAKLYPEGASRFANGDYSCITKLRSVLPDGKKVKHQVDLVLEACNRMQNLRTAIEDFKKASESVDKTEEERARAHHSGVHYLIRYFNLIAFAAYLDESYDREAQKLLTPFADWMEQHPHITAMHAEAQLN